MLQTPIAKLTALLITALTLWAASRGRWPERIGAAVIATDWAGTVLFQDHHPDHHLQPVWFVLDAMQAAVLLALAVSCRRRWVLWGAACALLLVLTHVTVLLDLGLGQWSYLTASYIWGWGLFAALGLGVALEGPTSAGPPLGLGHWRARQA